MLLVILLFLTVVIMFAFWSRMEQYEEGVSMCQTPGRLLNARNQRDERVLNMAKSLTKELLDHLQKQTYKSKNAREIVGWMNASDVYLFVGKAGGRMKRQRSKRRACMFINPNKRDNRVKGRLQSKICHEIAHLTGKGHDRKWRDTWKYLLNLSSRDLGWENELECGSCRKYKLCNKKMCPRCTWLEGDHTTCKPLNRRGTRIQA